MNRFGWLVLTLFFGVGAFAIWATALDDDRPTRPAPVARTADRQPIHLQMPVAGVARMGLVDSWQDPRDGGARVHQAIDIPAAGGTPVTAALAGRVEKLYDSRDGGTTAYVRSHDGRWSTYYAHLSGYAPGLAEGQPVAAGQPIGFVGDTGNAGPGNTHLHFALHRMAPGERWYQGTPVDPYPYLTGPYLARKPAAR